MPTSFRRIAHPTDLAQDSEFAFYHALRLAVAARSHLDVLHVDKAAHATRWGEYPGVGQTLTKWGFPADALQRNGDGDRLRAIAAYGTEPVHPIIEYLDEALPDLMVLATHRRHGLDRWLHKEIAQKLARSRAVSTLFVPYGDEGFVSPSQGTVLLRQVVIPVDWIPVAQAAVDAVADLGTVLGCPGLTVTLLHVSEKTEDFPPLEPPEREGWTWKRQTRSGAVVDEVLAVAEDVGADLVAMVTQGHDGFLDALRGSTTERVLQRVRCPLLAVPSLDAGL
jgi:nucleotide-binding universal stress UspA family protein